MAGFLGAFYVKGMDEKDKASMSPFNTIFDLKYSVLMQYTGLKDKNGKEIYEGDLVRWDDSTYEIQWSGYDGWIMKDDREDYDCPNLYWQEYSVKKGNARVEVVGNIYENTDLISK